MPRGFDPDKARTAALATIEAAEKRKAKAQAKLEPFQARLERAQKALAKAREGVELEEKVIARQKAYLAATENLDAPPAEAQVVAAEGVESGEQVGEVGGQEEQEPLVV